MPSIFAGITSLIQYNHLINFHPHLFRPERCIYCGRNNPWCHGPYSRKSDRSNTVEESLNPILIQRYYCPWCRRTSSVLPECIPPRRWYLWEVQQVVFLLFTLGKSVYAIAKTAQPSRYTIRRWVHRFQEQFRLHKDALCNHFIELGRTSGMNDFWQACLNKITLGSAMRLCHVSGVAIP